MNNVRSIDYAVSDLTHDQDLVLSRYISEYPRMASNFRQKGDSLKAPWGPKSDPIHFNAWQDMTLSNLHSCRKETTLGGSTFERGIWYYAGIPMKDHHEMAGLDTTYSPFHVILGTEYRPQIYINMLNRIRLLDCGNESQKSKQKKGAECFRCQKKWR